MSLQIPIALEAFPGPLLNCSKYVKNDYKMTPKMNPVRIQFKPINRPIPSNGTIMEPTVSVKLFARALWKLGSPEFEPWDADLGKRQLRLQRAMGMSAPEWYPRAHRRAFEPGGPLCIFCDQRTKNAHPYIHTY